MPSSRFLIASNTLGSAAASVTFSSIPATYTDLVVKFSANTSSDGETIYMRLNSDTASNYSFTRVAGYGSTVSSDRGTSQTNTQIGDGPSTSNLFTSNEIYIPSYTASQNKPISTFSVLERNSTTSTAIMALANLWRNTAAVSTILLYPGSGNFTTNSTFWLYGLKNS